MSKTHSYAILLAAAVCAGCTNAYDLDADLQGGGQALRLPEECLDSARFGIAPKHLRCTGLYSDIEDKRIAPGVRMFEPAYPLWSDNAKKRRWVYLPPGEKIDASDPNGWEMPVGTRLFKEFSWRGRRVETRMFYKEDDNFWVKAAYHWNEDETEATRHAGGDVDVDGRTYTIPTPTQCDQCHKGRVDRALGFEAILLGLPDAQGVTLEDLRSEDLLDDDGMPEEIEIGDDGTSKAARALGFLHTNCGVSCHNGNSSSEAYRTDLRLSLDAMAADGEHAEDYEAFESAIGVETTTERWQYRYQIGQDSADQTRVRRIVPGVPEASLLYWLLIQRNPNKPDDQMPPIATKIVDWERVGWVEQWIRSMPRDPEVPVVPLPF